MTVLLCRTICLIKCQQMGLSKDYQPGLIWKKIWIMPMITKCGRLITLTSMFGWLSCLFGKAKIQIYKSSFRVGRIRIYPCFKIWETFLSIPNFWIQCTLPITFKIRPMSPILVFLSWKGHFNHFGVKIAKTDMNGIGLNLKHSISENSFHPWIVSSLE